MFGEEGSELVHFKRRIGNGLVLKDVGQPRYFLNMEIDRTYSDVVVLSQPSLIEKLLANTSTSESKPTIPWMNPGFNRLPHYEPHDYKRTSTYRSIVGILLYLAVKTRLDFDVPASKLGLRLASAMTSNMTAAKGAFQDCQGTKDVSLDLRSGTENHLNDLVKADLAGDQKSNRRCRSSMFI